MKKWSLLTKTKNREIINSVKCNSFEEAIEYFAEKKKLPITDLISIFEEAILSTDPAGGTSGR